MSTRSIVFACLCFAASGLATHNLDAAENKGKVKMQDFHFTKKTDKSSPMLLSAPSGTQDVTPAAGGVVAVTDIAKDKPKPPPPPPPPTTGGIVLSDVLISNYNRTSPNGTPGQSATPGAGTGIANAAKIRPSDIPIIKPVDKSSPALPLVATGSPLKSLQSLGSANDLFVNKAAGVPTAPLPGAPGGAVGPLGANPVAMPGNPVKATAVPSPAGGATGNGASVKPVGVATPPRVDAPKRPLQVPAAGGGKPATIVPSVGTTGSGPSANVQTRATR